MPSGKLRILYIAFSCGPNRGSEDAIGWNLPLAMARLGNEVFVLTRADKRKEIESYLAEHPDEQGPVFLYEAQTSFELRMGGPLVSAKVASWCRRVSDKLPSIAKTYNIGIVHQITPVEFRSIINADIKDTPMFLGPIGGAEEALPSLASYLRGEWLLELLRRWENRRSARRLKRNNVFERFSKVWCANYETRDYLKKRGIGINNFEILTDIGVSHIRDSRNSTGSARQDGCRSETRESKIRLVYVGRLIPRKGVAVLLDACSILHKKRIPFELEIYGEGPQKKDLQRKAAQLHLSEVNFRGVLPHAKIVEAYLSADVLVMPSIRETGGTVLAEAAMCNTPVIAFKAFGARVVLHGRSSILVNPFDGVSGLASAIEQAVRNNVQNGDEMIEVAQSLLWSRKASHFQRCYQESRSVSLSKESQV